MGNYTVIVDDSDSRLVYGPGEGSWGALTSSNMYQGTVHHAMSSNVNMTFSFVGGHEVFVKGNFVGDNNATDSTTYPIFQVDSSLKSVLNCSPNTPQNGGQFVCSTSLPPTIANHTLTMLVNSNAAFQQFNIDYIRYGSSSQAAQNENEASVYVKAPDTTTSGLLFEGDWPYQSIGGANDTSKARQTSTASSRVTYLFVGDSFTLWACCIPITTSSNAAEVTYTIDGGDSLSFQIDETFIQGTQCRDQKILFQIQPGQIQNSNHTVEVVYGGNSAKIPLSVCALASVPVDFSILDVTPQITPSSSTSSTPSTQKYIIGGIVCGAIILLIILFVSITWWRRKQAKHKAKLRGLDSIAPFPRIYRPLVRFRHPAAEKPTLTVEGPATTVPNDIFIVPSSANEEDRDINIPITDTHLGSSGLETRLPSYRTVCIPVGP